MSTKAKIITVKYKYIRYILKVRKKGCDKDVSIQRGKDKDIKIQC